MDNNNSTQNININNERNPKSGRELFYGVIGLATFIIIAVGATFAYFTASTNSGSTDVKTRSAKAELGFISFGDAWMKEKLIPVEDRIVEYSIEKQGEENKSSDNVEEHKNAICKDDADNDLCSMYVFQVENKSNAAQGVTISLASTTNSFANLYAIAYKVSESEDGQQSLSDPGFKGIPNDLLESDKEKFPVTDGSGVELTTATALTGEDADSNPKKIKPVYVNRDGITKELITNPHQATDTEITNFPKLELTKDSWIIGKAVPKVSGTDNKEVLATNVMIPGTKDSSSNIVTFMIALYIKETKDDQTEDDGYKEFQGTVIVETSDGKGAITGKISAFKEEETLSSDSFINANKTPEETDENS